MCFSQLGQQITEDACAIRTLEKIADKVEYEARLAVKEGLKND